MNFIKKNKNEQLIELDDNCISNKFVENLLNINIPNDSNLNELEFFTNYDHDLENSLINTIDKTQTILGKATLKKYISNYSYDKNNIKNIKKIVKHIQKNNIDTDLTDISENIENVLWFYKTIDENLNSMLEQLYFNLPIKKLNDYLNNHKILLNISSIYNIYIYPLTNILGPVVSILVPYIIARIYKINIPFNFFMKFIKKFFNNVTNKKHLFSMIIYVGLYVYSIYRQIKQAYDLKQIVNIFHKKIISLKKVLNKINSLFDNFSDFYKSPKLNPLLDELKTVPDKIQTFMLTGNVLYFINKFRNNDYLINILKLIGELDVIISIHKLLDSKNYSFATFKNKKNPYIYLKKMNHPQLKNPVKNTIKIKNNNLMITGPNAAGKSTFVKGIVVNIILAQTLGICCATKAIITPFKYIKTHLNTPDKLNTQSLFEAEMYKCKDIIDNIKHNNNKSLIILDELFSSTNYREGYSGSCAIIKKINEYPNVCTIITTHYEKIPEYSKTIGYKNYRFPVEKLDNKLKYTYNLKRGISKDFVALDILRINNFDHDIIKTAINISKSFNF